MLYAVIMTAPGHFEVWSDDYCKAHSAKRVVGYKGMAEFGSAYDYDMRDLESGYEQGLPMSSIAWTVDGTPPLYFQEIAIYIAEAKNYAYGPTVREVE